MVSKTKYAVSQDTIRALFHDAGLEPVASIAPLGAGEFNAVFAVTAGGREYALKIAPTDDAPILAYEKGMMRAEVFWYEQMRAHTSIRVPEVYVTDFSRKRIPTDYFIMEKLPGKTLDQMGFSKTEKQRAAAEVAKMTAQLHKIKSDQFGYVQSGLYESWYLAIRASVEALLGDCRKKSRRSRCGERLLRMIDRYRATLEKAECCMVSFDIWDPNIVCIPEGDGIQYAWIDPERSFWGDRILDFVCLEMMKPLAGKEATLAAYNAVAEQPILATEEEKIRYAIAEGYLGLIMETEKLYRYTPHHFGWWRNVAASAILYRSAFGALGK